MTLLIRFILVVIIIYLLVRSFVRYFAEEGVSHSDQEHKKETKSNGVSKEVGEYVDYEEVD
jgi:flagellar biosynthesis/type III secretory pathway M-ring protein FliF/YscJ